MLDFFVAVLRRLLFAVVPGTTRIHVYVYMYVFTTFGFGFMLVLWRVFFFLA